MTAAAGVYLAACALLAVAGLAKVRKPAATQRALSRVHRRGLAVPAWVVRAGGGAEMVLGVAALGTAAPVAAAAVAICYLGFAGFVAASLARGGGAPGCGCFGEAGADVPLGPLHAAVNLALAAAALTVAAAGGLHAPRVERTVVVLLAAGLAWVTYLVLVPLPRLLATVRETGR